MEDRGGERHAPTVEDNSDAPMYEDYEKATFPQVETELEFAPVEAAPEVFLPGEVAAPGSPRFANVMEKKTAYGYDYESSRDATETVY